MQKSQLTGTIKFDLNSLVYSSVHQFFSIRIFQIKYLTLLSHSKSILTTSECPLPKGQFITEFVF